MESTPFLQNYSISRGKYYIPMSTNIRKTNVPILKVKNLSKIHFKPIPRRTNSYWTLLINNAVTTQYAVPNMLLHGVYACGCEFWKIALKICSEKSIDFFKITGFVLN